MSDSENEIERAWILNTEKVDIDKLTSSRVHYAYHEVGYIDSDEHGEMRVVKKESYPVPLLFLTVKSRGDLSRKEWEVLIPTWVFDQLWKRTDGSRLVKTRHYIEYSYYPYSQMQHNARSCLLELDEYDGPLSGLYRMECEFPSVKEAGMFALPKDLEGCAHEITDDVRFKNKNLATNGLPDGWKDIFNQ